MFKHPQSLFAKFADVQETAVKTGLDSLLLQKQEFYVSGETLSLTFRTFDLKYFGLLLILQSLGKFHK